MLFRASKRPPLVKNSGNKWKVLIDESTEQSAIFQGYSRDKKDFSNIFQFERDSQKTLSKFIKSSHPKVALKNGSTPTQTSKF